MRPSGHLVRKVAVVLLVVVLVLVGTYVALKVQGSAHRSGFTVLTTFYPIYDFTQNVAGTKANGTLLVPFPLDVHTFEPTPSSVAAVAGASVLIYNGAGLEPWIPDILAASGNPNLVVVNSSRGISTIPVPVQYQYQANQTTDPHVWLNPVLAKEQLANILAGLIQADPADAAYFTANAQAYDAKLDLLNTEAANLSANPATKYFVTFHEAFNYFAQQYGLTQISIGGPFEEDPTPSEIQGVVDAIHAHHLCYVGYESLQNPAISQSVANQTNATLLRLDPIEGLTSADQAVGKTYLIKMQEDLSNLNLALNHVGCS